MAYYLGVDVGTTYTAAAIFRDGRPEMAVLGSRTAAIPTLVYIAGDADVVIGEAARRRLQTDPTRVASEFKRRVGDSVPIFVDETPRSPESLLALVLRWTFDRVTEQEGSAPTRTVVTHPANWGPYRRELFEQAIRLANVPNATSITEPEAAAVYYASSERVEPGEVVAVYDLGGGTFDAALLRKTDTSFDLIGTPEGVEHLGGLDVDEAVFEHVKRQIGGAIGALDADDPAVVQALRRLRAECGEAKEALSFDASTAIPVMLPTMQTQVRITRAELERMIRPLLGTTIASLHRAFESAGVEPADIRSVLLVGGSSRIPLVAEMIGAEVGRPVAVDAHPKHAVALGAAITAAQLPAPDTAPAVEPTDEPPSPDIAAGVVASTLVADDAGAPVAPPVPPPVPDAPPEPPSAPLEAEDYAPPAPAEVAAAPVEETEPAAEAVSESTEAEAPADDDISPFEAPAGAPPGGPRSRRGLAIGAAVLLVVVGIAAFFAISRPDDDDVTTSTDGGATTTTDDGATTTTADDVTGGGTVDGDVWAAAVSNLGGLVQFVPESGELVANLPIENIAEEPVVIDDVVWVGVDDPEDGVVVHQIAREDATTVGEIPLEVVSPAGIEMLAAGERLWVLAIPETGPAVAALIDGGEVVTRAEVDGAVSSTEPVTDGERLFVPLAEGAARVDTDGSVTVGTVPSTPGLGGGLAFTDEGLFAVRIDAVHALDPDTMEVTRSVPYTSEAGEAALFNSSGEATGIQIEAVFGTGDELSFLASDVPVTTLAQFIRVDAGTGEVLTRAPLPGGLEAGVYDLRSIDPGTYWAYMSISEPALLRIDADGRIEQFPLPPRGTGDPDLVTNGGRLLISDVDAAEQPVLYVIDPVTGAVDSTVDIAF